MEITLTYVLVWYSDRVTEIDVSSIILGPWSHFVLFRPSGRLIAVPSVPS